MGTIYIRWTVTDSASATANNIQSTALTSWVPWTGDDRFDIDTSGLTEGSATIKLEVKGYGQYKDVYIYQGTTDHIHTQPLGDLAQFNEVGYVTNWEKDFYLSEDNVYIGMQVKAL